MSYPTNPGPSLMPPISQRPQGSYGSDNISPDSLLALMLRKSGVDQDPGSPVRQQQQLSNLSDSVPPNNASYSVPANDASYAVPPNNASYAVPPNNVSYSVPPNNASYSVPPNNTSYSVPPNNASYSVPQDNVSYAQNSQLVESPHARSPSRVSETADQSLGSSRNRSGRGSVGAGRSSRGSANQSQRSADRSSRGSADQSQRSADRSSRGSADRSQRSADRSSRGSANQSQRSADRGSRGSVGSNAIPADEAIASVRLEPEPPANLANNPQASYELPAPGVIRKREGPLYLLSPNVSATQRERDVMQWISEDPDLPTNWMVENYEKLESYKKMKLKLIDLLAEYIGPCEGQEPTPESSDDYIFTLLEKVMGDLVMKFHKFNLSLDKIGESEIGTRIESHKKKVLDVVKDYETKIEQLTDENLQLKIHADHLDGLLSAEKNRSKYFVVRIQQLEEEPSTSMLGPETVANEEQFMEDLNKAFQATMRSSLMSELDRERAKSKRMQQKLFAAEKSIIENEEQCMVDLNASFKEASVNNVIGNVVQQFFAEQGEANEESSREVVDETMHQLEMAIEERERELEECKERLKQTEEELEIMLEKEQLASEILQAYTVHRDDEIDMLEEVKKEMIELEKRDLPLREAVQNLKLLLDSKVDEYNNMTEQYNHLYTANQSLERKLQYGQVGEEQHHAPKQLMAELKEEREKNKLLERKLKKTESARVKLESKLRKNASNWVLEEEGISLDILNAVRTVITEQQGAASIETCRKAVGECTVLMRQAIEEKKRELGKKEGALKAIDDAAKQAQDKLNMYKTNKEEEEEMLKELKEEMTELEQEDTFIRQRAQLLKRQNEQFNRRLAELDEEFRTKQLEIKRREREAYTDQAAAYGLDPTPANADLIHLRNELRDKLQTIHSLERELAEERSSGINVDILAMMEHTIRTYREEQGEANNVECLRIVQSWAAAMEYAIEESKERLMGAQREVRLADAKMNKMRGLVVASNEMAAASEIELREDMAKLDGIERQNNKIQQKIRFLNEQIEQGKLQIQALERQVASIHTSNRKLRKRIQTYESEKFGNSPSLRVPSQDRKKLIFTQDAPGPSRTVTPTITNFPRQGIPRYPNIPTRQTPQTSSQLPGTSRRIPLTWKKAAFLDPSYDEDPSDANAAASPPRPTPVMFPSRGTFIKPPASPRFSPRASSSPNNLLATPRGRAVPREHGLKISSMTPDTPNELNCTMDKTVVIASPTRQEPVLVDYNVTTSPLVEDSDGEAFVSHIVARVVAPVNARPAADAEVPRALDATF